MAQTSALSEDTTGHTVRLMEDGWYVYVVHESPIAKPYYVKVGYTQDPLRRLAALQAGNPRHLRSADRERKPNSPFGFRCESEEQAKTVETAVHERLREYGCGLRSDYDYETGTSVEREWFSDIHPDEVWLIVTEEYCRVKRDLVGPAVRLPFGLRAAIDTIEPIRKLPATYNFWSRRWSSPPKLFEPATG